MEDCDGCAGNVDWDARRSDATRIRSLEAGDLFHAAGITRGGMICIVTGVTDAIISARQIPSAVSGCRFDRASGDRFPDATYSPSDDGTCRIDSVEPLPTTIHGELLDMDRQCRLRPMENRLPGDTMNWEAWRLAHDHFAAHAFDREAAAGDSQ
jgi:hypothetical protein